MPHNNPSTTVAFIAFAVLALASASLYGQDAPSVADIARQARAAQNKKTQASPESGAPARSQSTTAETSDNGGAHNNAVSKPGAQPDGMDLHYNERYENSIRKLFEQDKFEAIDQLADTARSTRARLPGGFWALHIIYSPLMRPAKDTYDASDSEWNQQLDGLKRWVSQRPKSVTARVALAGAYLQYGWKARGGGYANTVTEDGWRVFGERVDMAAKTLEDAFALPVKCPEWYLTMQFVARAQGLERDAQDAIFEKAVAFDPEYHYFYRAQAESLLPKWGGEEGEMARFAGRIADRVGGKKGDAVYYLIATYLICACDADRQLYGMSWPRIKRGFEGVEELYGQSILHLNNICYMASLADDYIYAQKLFALIGDKWDEERWHDKKHFDETRQFANFFATMEKAREEGLKAVEENLKSPEGRAFDARIRETLAASLGSAITECQKFYGDFSGTPFDLVVRLGQNGAVEQLYDSAHTGVSACVGGKIRSNLLPAPPKPAYWVKISPEIKR